MVVLVTVGCVAGATAQNASALSLKPICGAAGLVNGLAGKACSAAQNGKRLLGAGKKLLGGHVGGAVKTALGQGAGQAASTAAATLALAAVGAWVGQGAASALHDTATVLGETTAPQLTTTWFSATYWRIAGIAAVLTLPFLFAAAIQALLRSDLALLLRATLGYLPLSMLAVTVAAPLTMLLLAASDQMSAAVSAAAGHASGRLLTEAGAVAGALTALSHSPFLAVLIGLFTVAGTLVLWMELLMREAAVYVIVLMLPLAFAAMVWPARRIWAVRAVELLVALILSKFAIVAVLSLGGAALSRGFGHLSITGFMAGLVLVVMGAFAPWALLRLLPLTELASGAMGSLRADSRAVQAPLGAAWGRAGVAEDWAASRTAQMRRDAEDADAASPRRESAGSGAVAEAQRLADAARTGGAADASDVARQADSGGGVPGTAPAADPPSGNGVRDAASSSPAAPDERLPGMGAIWQMPDKSWRPITLGPGEEWPPRLTDAEDDVSGSSNDRSGDYPPADHPDPTPPPQASDEGEL
jgi:hypothetical protein